MNRYYTDGNEDEEVMKDRATNTRPSSPSFRFFFLFLFIVRISITSQQPYRGQNHPDSSSVQDTSEGSFVTKTMAMPSPNLVTAPPFTSASGRHAEMPVEPKEEKTHRESTVTQYSIAFTTLKLSLHLRTCK